MGKAAALLTVIIVGLVLTPSCRPVEPVFPLEPQVLLLSPADGSVFPPGFVTVRAYVENFNLVDKVGQANVPGEGHLIYYLDVLPPVTMGESAIPASGTYVISTTLSYTWENLTPGDHILAVQAVNNDNTPLRYPSAVRVYITIKA
jgi:hypothetical protein